MVKCGHKVLDGKNGAVPVCIDGHDPVDHGKGEGDDHDENKDLGIMLQLLKVSPVRPADPPSGRARRISTNIRIQSPKKTTILMIQKGRFR